MARGSTVRRNAAGRTIGSRDTLYHKPPPDRRATRPMGVWFTEEAADILEAAKTEWLAAVEYAAMAEPVRVIDDNDWLNAKYVVGDGLALVTSSALDAIGADIVIEPTAVKMGRVPHCKHGFTPQPHGRGGKAWVRTSALQDSTVVEEQAYIGRLNRARILQDVYAAMNAYRAEGCELSDALLSATEAHCRTL